MTPEETEKAATLIWEKWDADELLDELPEDCRPQTELEAHGIQSVFPKVSDQVTVTRYVPGLELSTSIIPSFAPIERPEGDEVYESAR